MMPAQACVYKNWKIFRQPLRSIIFRVINWNVVKNYSFYCFVFQIALLWTAPELIQKQLDNAKNAASPKGDVYSFAIIVHEIVFRRGPYSMDADETATAQGL